MARSIRSSLSSCRKTSSSTFTRKENFLQYLWKREVAGQVIYRVTILRGYNLPLTWFRHFRQLVGCYCSYLLSRQDGGTYQI